MSDSGFAAGDCSPLVAEDKVQLVSRFTEMICKMKEGVPLIRRIQSDIREKNETTICMAFLSDDLAAIKFVKQSEEPGKEISVSVMELSAIDAVGYSTSDKHGVGLLIGSEEIIVTLIFASEEDWTCWYSSLRVLCARGAVDEDWEQSSQDTAVQHEDDGALIPELVSLVGELQKQNSELKEMMNNFSHTVGTLRSALEEEEQKRKAAEAGNVRLKKLLLVREDTVGELSVLIQTLLKKQREIMEDDSRVMAPKIDKYFIGSAMSSRRDSTETADLLSRPSTASTPTRSDYSVLGGLESQLRQLEARKQQLEKMLASVTGS